MERPYIFGFVLIFISIAMVRALHDARKAATSSDEDTSPGGSPDARVSVSLKT
jgi:hypothetical protein